MSKILKITLACTLATQVLAQSPAQQAAALYQKGQAAEKAGDPNSAKTYYTNALKADPQNPDARFSLGQLKLTSGNISAKSRETKFGTVMIPAFQLDQASFKEALDGFAVILEKESKAEITPNFIIEDPKNLLAERKITLNLKKVPSQAVMKYLMEQANAKARFDEHAIVISPR